jgi:membrane fusion protein (multidrug efflux system)
MLWQKPILKDKKIFGIKKIGSEIQYLQAQTQMVSAQKGVAQMKAQLAKTLIKAPFQELLMKFL